jgi:hypothetical protein
MIVLQHSLSLRDKPRLLGQPLLYLLARPYEYIPYDYCLLYLRRTTVYAVFSRKFEMIRLSIAALLQHFTVERDTHGYAGGRWRASHSMQRTRLNTCTTQCS